MRVREVGCDQGSCDVSVAMCVRACVCVCVCVFDENVSRMFFDVYFSNKSKKRSNCHVELGQCGLRCRSVNCAVFRAAVTSTG